MAVVSFMRDGLTELLECNFENNTTLKEQSPHFGMLFLKQQ